MNILHICAGWQPWNGAANIARMIIDEQQREGCEVSYTTWAKVRELRSADEVWIHCGWLPCLWWAALWGRNVHWMPEACYDPIRLRYHGWKKALVGPIERFCLRRAKVLVATCEAEKGWIQSYLGKHCPPVEVTDIKRFFNLNHVDHVELEQAENKELHLLYLGRRHPLKGLSCFEAALRQIEETSAPRGALRLLRSSLRSPIPTPCGAGASRLCAKIISNAFGDELEKVWEWCDVLVLPTLSDNFGLVIAEALERGKRVITTDGAPAWGPEECDSVEMLPISNPNNQPESQIWKGYGGRLIYLKGYRDGTPEERVWLLKNAIEELACRS